MNVRWSPQLQGPLAAALRGASRELVCLTLPKSDCGKVIRLPPLHDVEIGSGPCSPGPQTPGVAPSSEATARCHTGSRLLCVRREVASSARGISSGYQALVCHRKSPQGALTSDLGNGTSFLGWRTQSSRGASRHIWVAHSPIGGWAGRRPREEQARGSRAAGD